LKVLVSDGDKEIADKSVFALLVVVIIFDSFCFLRNNSFDFFFPQKLSDIMCLVSGPLENYLTLPSSRFSVQ
jgi:hypothetical protein